MQLTRILQSSLFSAIFLLAITPLASPPASACTRVLYTGADNLVITGRSMDWNEQMQTDLWALPAGLKRNGAAGPNSIEWTSKYGSVVTAGYNAGTADGMNEKGLVTNLLYLAESDYGKADPSRPQLSILAWPQYILDNFATVDEAVKALKKEPFQIVAPTLPNGRKAALHVAISDASGDSAILEYIDGKLVIHHDRKYTVMTNSPTYDQQLALDTYWHEVGGMNFLPGTIRAADRYARASFLLDAIPKKPDPDYMAIVPHQKYAYEAVASVLGVVRAVGVPLGISTKKDPNISSTLWRTVADQKDKIYYFDSATRPNTLWVDLNQLDLKKGAPVMKLPLANGQVYSGEVSGNFTPAKPFKFLPGDFGKKGSKTQKQAS